jgi:beta-glucosidase
VTDLETGHRHPAPSTPGASPGARVGHAPGARRFPAGFLWGAATSAYQIEGGVEHDGRSPSIWDTFARAGHARGDTGDTAADHRRRMADDVALMARLGLRSYRFSVAWPRVQPAAGAPSASGLDFYRALVDELLGRGIEPVATLYHWDLPHQLEVAGGWPARDTAGRFGDYAGLVGEALGDRVRRWTTINEPWCAAMLGYGAGIHAPGRADPGADVDAARRIDGIANRLWYDPVLRGSYPDDVLADLASVSDLGHIRDGDLATIARPIDALGLNYYRRHHVRHQPGASASPSPWPGSPDVAVIEAADAPTSNGWAVEPDGLLDTLVRLHADYDPPPLYIHESGGAFPDRVTADGRVRDLDRISYLDAHIRACHDAIAAGVDLRGFFVWSLLDNFEWAEGYAQRFGIVHVDFDTQERIFKDSALWYRDVMHANGLGAGPSSPPGDGPAS